MKSNTAGRGGSMSQSEKEYLYDLYARVGRANKAYYIDQSPILSDDEYDSIVKEIRGIEADHPDWVLPESPTQRVSGEVSTGFKKERHPQPILSLANAYSRDELGAWLERITRLDERVRFGRFVAEPKFDGLTVVLHYENGVFTRGVTRGDGVQGEDVSSNIRTIKTVPMKLTGTHPARLVVRGEAIIENKDFEKLNAALAEKGEKTYLTPRNTASGALRNIDPKVTAARPLKVFAYAVVDGDPEVTALGQWEKLQYLKDAGFLVSRDITLCASLEEIWAACTGFANKRAEMAFDIDGVVIKVDDASLMDSLGVAGKDPRGAIAYKFPAQEKSTKLLQVGLQVGRSGVITPVAIMRPVEIGGVVVEQATLHNFAYIEDRDIRIGDTVLIKRAGDVIPYVMGVLFEVRDGSEQPFSRPENCPVCGSKLEASETDIALYCRNTGCPARVLRALQMWVSKSGMNIISLGDRVVEDLYNKGLIKDVVDIYLLTKEQLVELEGFGPKKAENILASIEESRSRPLATVISSLQIEGVGESTAEDLAARYPDFRALRAITREGLLQIENIGEKIADSILKWFSQPVNLALLERLEGQLNPPAPRITGTDSGKLLGLTFVITGTLTQPRAYYESRIKENGGSIVDSVSKKTSYLLLGENPGSKLEKARKNGVTVISENDLADMLS